MSDQPQPARSMRCALCLLLPPQLQPKLGRTTERRSRELRGPLDAVTLIHGTAVCGEHVEPVARHHGSIIELYLEAR